MKLFVKLYESNVSDQYIIDDLTAMGATLIQIERALSATKVWLYVEDSE